MKIAAVDIGKNGAFAFIVNDKTVIEKMPQTPRGIAELIERYSPGVLYAENVHAFPGQGAVTTGVLMRAKGIIEGVCAKRCELVLIKPSEWTSEYGRVADCLSEADRLEYDLLKNDKNPVAKKSAKKLFAKAKIAWKNRLKEIAQSKNQHLKVTLASADALLILDFAIRNHDTRVRHAKILK